MSEGTGRTSTAPGPGAPRPEAPARRPAPRAAVPTAKGAPEEPVLDLTDVTVVRDGRPLLDEVSWAVGADERWVVLGPNGAGKTTLLQVASGRMHPTRGRAEVLGEELGLVDVFELRPRIGLASAALAERVPAAEKVVDVVLTASYGMVGRWREEYEGPDHERARELLVTLGVGGLEQRTYGTLSEGERKRVQIARALMSDPELVLLDEPAAGLDLGGREDLVRRLAALVADRAAPALVLVTHHVEEIPPGVTHALLLRAGRVVGQGPVDQVLTAEALGEAFGLRLQVERAGGRWSARSAIA
ncbi:ABC transporter ATP-binding protein [uncultured Pseudokineococcus sp.]|uniref:ABC transporter ATP-binding protein n=1 Tax=uncultured Pseudokineococcus sp. TaxID=1642928 RepID=UPI0026070ED4|nr:ABC transporter ATP-binding protein [uncultured Pseudokineococcus sp.]